TWAAFGTGRIPIGIDVTNTQFDVVKETGGSNVSSAVVSHTHEVTITDAGHNHLENTNSATTGGVSGWGARDTSTSTPSATGYYTAANTTGITASTSNPAGSVSSFSIMNPYIVVYMWERTA
ncbi:MAG: hypothetical protein MUO73_07060, partial [Thermoplasmata archaeon]|nr:hypothetical protein [Thermoplasmata archaeon]